MEGLAMVFQSELTEQDEGLYTCQASFYHHISTVSFQVEVMSEDKQFGEYCINLHRKNRVTDFLKTPTSPCDLNCADVCVAAMVFMVSMSSALAIFLIFIVTLCVCW